MNTNSTSRKYPALITILMFLRIVGWATIGLTVIGFIHGMNSGTTLVGIGSGIVTLVVGAIWILLIFATVEILQVIIDIEENTLTTAEQLASMTAGQQSSGSVLDFSNPVSTSRI